MLCVFLHSGNFRKLYCFATILRFDKTRAGAKDKDRVKAKAEAKDKDPDSTQRQELDDKVILCGVFDCTTKTSELVRVDNQETLLLRKGVWPSELVFTAELVFTDISLNN